jgi:hypothetical protein
MNAISADEAIAPDGFDVEGPVQAEVFVVWLNGDRLELTGPCGAAPWMLELGETEHPVDVVDRIVRDVVGPPLLVHSTSWRRDHGAVILSFVVVIDAALVVHNMPGTREQVLASAERVVQSPDAGIARASERE